MRRTFTTILLAVLSVAADDPVPGPPLPTGVVANGPMEVRIRYWPAIDKASEKAIIEDVLKRSIPYYEPAWLDDGAVPRGEALGRLRIAGARVAEQGSTLILATDPHPRRAVYLLDWMMDDTTPRASRYLYSGVEWSWHYGPDEPPARSMPQTFTGLRDLTIRPGLGGQHMSRRPEYPRKVVLWTSLLVPKGTKETLVLRGNMPFAATVGNQDAAAAGSREKPEAVEVALQSTGEPIELTVTLTTAKIGPSWDFAALWKRGGKEVLIPQSQLALPWLPVIPPAAKAPEPPYRLDGGDPAKGAEVFASEAAKCVSCHAIGGKGGAIGPSLDGLKDRDLAMIYRDIAEPSAVIVPEYLTYTVARKDGQIAVGIVRAEGFDSIRVADINGMATIIPKAEIEEMRPSTTSTMPVGLAGALGEEKMRDLLAFLRSGKK